jgi:hypothetical protein
MSEDLHDEMLDKNERFKELHDAAMDHKRKGMVDKNQYVLSAENATHNWFENTTELQAVYKKLRENRNHEFTNIIDDNSTLLRQTQINHDMLIRRRYLNQFLKIIVIFIAIIILIGYMNHLNYNFDIILVVLLIVFLLFAITCITTFLYQRKMHSLEFERISFPGYPVMNEDVQNEYVGDCSNYNGSNMKSIKCSGLA